LFAQDFPTISNPPRLVNDFAKILNSQEVQYLEQKLVAYDDSTSTQITIVTLNSIGGDDINLYTAELAEKWHIGQKGKDNGLIMLLSMEDKKISIQVGYGLEHIVTDAISKRIIEEYILPEFRKGDFGAGLNEGANQVIKALAGEFKGKGKSVNKNTPWIPIGFLILLILITLVGKNRG